MPNLNKYFENLLTDYKKYKNTRSQDENPKTSWHNPHTIGFSLYPPPSEKKKKTYFNVPLISKQH